MAPCKLYKVQGGECNGQQGLLCMNPPLGGMAVQASEKEAAARGQEEREK